MLLYFFLVSFYYKFIILQSIPTLKNTESDKIPQQKFFKSAKSIFDMFLPEPIAETVSNKFNKVASKFFDAAESTSFYLTPLGLPCDPNKTKLCSLRVPTTTTTTPAPNNGDNGFRKHNMRRKHYKEPNLENISLLSGGSPSVDQSSEIIPYHSNEYKAIQIANRLVSNNLKIYKDLSSNTTRLVELPNYEPNLSALEMSNRQLINHTTSNKYFNDIYGFNSSNIIGNLTLERQNTSLYNSNNTNEDGRSFLLRHLEEEITDHKNTSQSTEEEIDRLNGSYYVVPAYIETKNTEVSYIPINRNIEVLYNEAPHKEQEPTNYSINIDKSCNQPNCNTTHKSLHEKENLNAFSTLEYDKRPKLLPPIANNSLFFENTDLIDKPCFCQKDGCTPEFCNEYIKKGNIDSIDYKQYNLSPLFAGRLMALKNEEPLLMLYKFNSVSDDVLSKLEPEAIIKLDTLISKAKLLE